MSSSSRKTKLQVQNYTVKNQAWEIAQVLGDLLLLLLKILWTICEAIFRLAKPVPEKSVKGEIVLITGGSHGIGKELALLYASQGAKVVCCSISEEDNRETVDEIIKLGHKTACYYTFDVSDHKLTADTIAKIEKEVGDITILINNAGIMPSRPLLQHSADEIRRMVDVNLTSHFWTLRAVLPTMLKNNYGHIVATSSCCGLLGMENLVPYCSSKFAIRGLMYSLKIELNKDPKCKIKTTVVYPYIVNTGLCKSAKIRFPKLTPILDQRYVAERIMSAQRRNVVETSVPGHLLPTFNFLKLFPERVQAMAFEFMGIEVESDLSFPFSKLLTLLVSSRTKYGHH